MKYSQHSYEFLERKPQPDWFLTVTNEFGEKEIFVRVQVTGLFPRHFGPFETKEVALEFLDGLLSEIWESMNEILNHHQGKRGVVEDLVYSSIQGD